MKQTTTPAQLLAEVIENAVIAAKPGVTIDAQASLLISEERALIDANTPAWQHREVVRLLRAKRLELARKRRAEDQYVLPGFEGLPQRIVIREGKRRPLARATYRQLRDYFEFLRKRQLNNPRLTQVKALVQLVQGYARMEPGITVKEVWERESAK